MKLLRTGYRGSFSIEAALIYPFIFLLLISIIFSGFYIHDKLIAKSQLMKNMYSESLSLSVDNSIETIFDNTKRDIENYTIISGDACFTKEDHEDYTSFSATLAHNTVFIPYLQKTSCFHGEIRGFLLCRRINRYTSLFTLIEN